MTTEIMAHVSEFRNALQSGIDGFVRCGEIYVAAIDADANAATTFSTEFADVVPANMWSNFEAIGRRWMHPRLLMGGMSDRKKAAIVKRLPYSTQERIFSHDRFELLVGAGDTLRIDVMDATLDQMDQLFDGSSVRNLSAQRAWLESKKTAQKTSALTLAVDEMPYTISDGYVVFRKGVKLTRAEVKRLLTEM